MADRRTFNGGRVAVAVDGVRVDALRSFAGLDMQATIVSDAVGPNGFSKKHVSDISWSPGQISTGLAMGRGLHGWIKAMFDNVAPAHNGSVVLADFNYKAQSVLAFTNALLTSVTFPRLDGNSQEAGHIDVAFAAQQVRQSAGDGSDVRGPLTPVVGWQCANFRLELGSLPCARVASIESFTLTCAVVADQVGIFREPTKAAWTYTVPDLRVAVSYSDHALWAQAAQQWFINGVHLEGNEMQGAIVLLGADMQTELGRITLGNVGFKRFAEPAYAASAATADQVMRFTVDLYVEKMGFQLAQYTP